MFGARSSFVRYSKHFINLHQRSSTLCNSNNPNNKLQNPLNNNISGNKVNDIRELDAYRDLDKLDFMKAAKILFSNPPKQKKFGLDFHLVQLFFALMPPLAVYLVAQYARYEIRKMEAEVELKKKAEEEKKAKEMEAIAAEEKEAESDPELLKVKERLEALEEAVKEIGVKAKEQSSDVKEHPNSISERSRAAARNQPPRQEATSGSGQPLKKQDSELKGSHRDENK